MKGREITIMVKLLSNTAEEYLTLNVCLKIGKVDVICQNRWSEVVCVHGGGVGGTEESIK